MAKKPPPDTLQWSMQQRITGFTLHVTFGKENNSYVAGFVKALAMKGCQLKPGFDLDAVIAAEHVLLASPQDRTVEP